jgi:phage protein D
MTYPIRPHVAQKRTEKQAASVARKERFWADRMARAANPKERAQVLYDRLRSAPDDSLPMDVNRALWQMVVDGLAALVTQAEEQVERARAARREERLTAGRDVAKTFW